MSRRSRIRLSRWTSVLWLLFVGWILIAAGVSAIPEERFGIEDAFLLLVPMGIAAFHATNLFARRGVAYDVVLEEEEGANADFDTRLRKLGKLREDGLLAEEEYARKRAEILGEKG